MSRWGRLLFFSETKVWQKNDIIKRNVLIYNMLYVMSSR